MNTNGNSPSSQIQNVITALAEAAAALQSIAMAEPGMQADDQKGETDFRFTTIALEGPTWRVRFRTKPLSDVARARPTQGRYKSKEEAMAAARDTDLLLGALFCTNEAEEE